MNPVSDTPSATLLLSVQKACCDVRRRRRAWLGSREGATDHHSRCDHRVERIVDDVSFDMRAGDALALLGESGSGKTTLARMIVGAVAPSSGRILINGSTVSVHDRRALGRWVQLIHQDPTGSLNPRLTVMNALCEPLDVIKAGTRPLRRRRAEYMLERVGLGSAFLSRYPHELSGGQRQRVAIARALVREPALLVCDEPTSALDVSVQAEIVALLAGLRVSLGLTLLFITHNLAVARLVCDTVAVMHKGRIVETGSTDEVFERPRHEFTRRLCDAAL